MRKCARFGSQIFGIIGKLGTETSMIRFIVENCDGSACAPVLLAYGRSDISLEDWMELDIEYIDSYCSSCTER